MPAPHPIGVYDSGVGGLSVLRAIREALPHEHLLYVADSAHVPYGEKTQQYVQQRALAIADYAAIMVHGQITRVGQPQDVTDEVSAAYLGA